MRRLPYGLLCLLLAACASEPRKAVPNDVVFAATPVPDRIVLTWAADPASSQSVTWRTDGSGADGVGEIAVATDGPEFRKQVRRVAAEQQQQVDGARYHTVTFAGLDASTRYVYRVGDGVDWSEWSHFSTASVEPEPFSFLYFGDAQNDLKSHWSRVIREAFRDAPRAAFVVHAGDLVNRGFRDGEWGEWFYSAGWILRSMPSIATPGNHEYRKGELSKFWRPQFAFPLDGPKGFEETVYSLEYQGVLLVSLDTNRELEPQVAWLDGVVAESDANWKIVTMHHPVFGTAKKRDSPKRRAILQPAFDRNGIDLVLQGHDHTYSRTARMRHAHAGDEGEHEHAGENVPTGLRARDDETGTVYVVSVSGPKMYQLLRQPFMVKATEKKQLYQVLSIDGDRLTYSARTATGRLFDRFELRKRSGGPNELVETMPR
ncbi:MAG: metallophosphoesterase [Planctomycetota bacterium]